MNQAHTLSDRDPSLSGHPGFEASECPLRMTIRNRSGICGSGFACAATGSHCRPASTCASLQASWTAQQSAARAAIG